VGRRGDHRGAARASGSVASLSQARSLSPFGAVLVERRNPKILATLRMASCTARRPNNRYRTNSDTRRPPLRAIRTPPATGDLIVITRIDRTGDRRTRHELPARARARRPLSSHAARLPHRTAPARRVPSRPGRRSRCRATAGVPGQPHRAERRQPGTDPGGARELPRLGLPPQPHRGRPNGPNRARPRPTSRCPRPTHG
jgi:hypothetical protein